MGWIIRTFRCRNTEFLRSIFNSLVHQHVDYCSQLWMPSQAQQMEKIGNLANGFTSKIPWLREESYWSRLKIFRLNSQERRMKRYRIPYTWKIPEKLVPNCGVELAGEAEDMQGRRCKEAGGCYLSQEASKLSSGRPKSLQLPAKLH